MKRVSRIVLGLLLLAGIVALGVWVWKMDGDDAFSVLIRGERRPEPDKERYEVLTGELERWREDLGADYRKAQTQAEKAAVEHDARLLLELVMPEMMRCWLGTKYDFNGTAEKPGEGTVACGYYVSTVIRDAGFRVNRYKLAQQPSENIMRTFLPSNACLLKVGQDFGSYADWVEEMEPGIYVIGLDTHVGFIVNQSDGMTLFHSSGSKPWMVVEEARKKAGVIQRSRWRMIGGLTKDPKVIRTWLAGEKVKIRN